MKEVNVKVLIPDDVDPEKIIDLSLVAKYQKKDDEWRFVTMPFVLSDSSENKGDLISKQTVLDLFQMKYSDKELYKAIYELPSVENKGE